MAMMVLSFIGCYFVLFPESANSLARVVGVGRGADLVLYCFMLGAFIAIFNVHLRLRSQSETMTELARQLAIAGSLQPEPMSGVHTDRQLT
jgi:small membrane protein